MRRPPRGPDRYVVYHVLPDGSRAEHSRYDDYALDDAEAAWIGIRLMRPGSSEIVDLQTGEVMPTYRRSLRSG